MPTAGVVRLDDSYAADLHFVSLLEGTTASATKPMQFHRERSLHTVTTVPSNASSDLARTRGPNGPEHRIVGISLIRPTSTMLILSGYPQISDCRWTPPGHLKTAHRGNGTQPDTLLAATEPPLLANVPGAVRPCTMSRSHRSRISDRVNRFFGTRKPRSRSLVNLANFARAPARVLPYSFLRLHFQWTQTRFNAPTQKPSLLR